MKKIVYLVAILFFGIVGIAQATVDVTSSNSGTIKTDVSSSVSTGDNSVSSGGSVSTGDTKASVNVVNSSGSTDNGTKVEIETGEGSSRVEVKSSSVSGGGSGTSSSVEVRTTVSSKGENAEVEIEGGGGNVEIRVNGEEIRVPDGAGKVKVEVRGWDPVNKKITIEPSEVDDDEGLQDYMKAIVASDDSIENVSVRGGVVSVDYLSSARLFGFIPWNLTPTVTVDINATSSEERVKVKFPWYHVFFKKEVDLSNINEELEMEKLSIEVQTQNKLNEVARTLQTISNILKTKHDTVKNSIGNIR